MSRCVRYLVASCLGAPPRSLHRGRVDRDAPALAIGAAPVARSREVRSANPAGQDETQPRSDSYARVATDDLRVRSKPGVSDESEKLEPLLQEGIRLLVLDGPVPASGYDWHQVKPIFDADTPEGGFPFGWVARAGKDGEPWIESEPQSCPSVPRDVPGLSSLFATAPPYAAITC